MDFTSYINERTQYFTGREWVFEKVVDWKNTSNSRMFLLVGGPGTGKSSIAAKLTQLSEGTATVASVPLLTPGWLAYSHFCQAGLEDTLSPLTFVASLSEALANRYEPFRKALEEKASSQIVMKQETGPVQPGATVVGPKVGQVRIEIKTGDARPLFDQAVRIPLKTLCDENFQDSIIILVDSLDEALTFNPENNITQLLKLVNDFPKQVRFVLTCRTNSKDVFKLLGQGPTLDLIANAPSDQKDEVEVYAGIRLSGVAEPQRSKLAELVALKSRGNFLYAFHVLNDLVAAGGIADANTLTLPDELDDLYRKFIEREMASSSTKWSDVYRPLLGPIAVALGEGLTREQLIGITELPEDKTDDVLKVCAQYLVGGDPQTQPYRIYHQSFRDFLLTDDQYSVYPAERHAAIAGYFQKECGANWNNCNDPYALRYTPAHWADSATLTTTKRDRRTQSLITLTGNKSFQTAFETQVRDLPALQDYLYRAVKVAALNERVDMLPWLVKATRQYGRFRTTFLRGESVVALAEQGLIRHAEKRLNLFTDLDEDWRTAARLIIAWLGADRDRTVAEELRDEVVANIGSVEPLEILRDRFAAYLNNESYFPSDEWEPLDLEIGRELIKRVSGQDFNHELLGSIDPELVTYAGQQSTLGGESRGFASNFDGPILVQMARVYRDEGTELVDAYIDAHAGYNYVEYRNRSLWMVLHAALRNNPDQTWLKERLRRLLVAALSGGAVDFAEMLPMTAALFAEKANQGNLRNLLDGWQKTALQKAGELQRDRRYNDSWGNHKRRLTALMELYYLVLPDENAVEELRHTIYSLPFGFAGFQAPANLRFAEALMICGEPSVETSLENSLRSAHNIQDYHFCARVTARCNALTTWHGKALSGPVLVDTIARFIAAPSDAEFAAQHRVHEPYQYRREDPQTLSAEKAKGAETLEQLVEVFQRPAVEFRRLNPHFGLTDKLADQTPIIIPDPGLAPLLAIHFAAAVLTDPSLTVERASLIQSLVPAALNNPTALDTVLSYLLIAAAPDSVQVMEAITEEIGPVQVLDVAPSKAQIGPDFPT